MYTDPPALTSNYTCDGSVGKQGVNLPKNFCIGKVLVACRGEIWGWSNFPAAVLLFHSKNNIDSPIFNLPLYRVGARG